MYSRHIRNEESKYSLSSYKLYFGSWSNAQREAGFVLLPGRGRRIVSSGNVEEKKEKLLANLKEVAQRLGHTPNTREIEEGQYSLTPYKKYFGSLANASITAGLDPHLSKRNRSSGLPADELQAKDVLLAHLKDLAQRLQHTPSAIEMNKKGDYTYLTYKKYFGSWKQAQMLAGLNLNSGGLKRIAAKEDILQIKKILRDEILNVYRDRGYPPTSAEMKKYGKYTDYPYRKYFGSWNRAITDAGLVLHKRSKNKIAESGSTPEVKALLISHFKEFAAWLKHVPSTSEMDKEGKFHSSTYIKYFNSWNKAKIAAGFEPNERKLKVKSTM